MTAIKTLPPKSEEVEREISDLLKYGDKTAICALTNYQEPTLNRWLNPFDDKHHESPQFRTLYIQWALDHTDTEKGDAVWAVLTTRRAMWRDKLNENAEKESLSKSRVFNQLATTELECHLIEALADGELSKEEAREAIQKLVKVEKAIEVLKAALIGKYNEANEQQIEPKNYAYRTVTVTK